MNEERKKNIQIIKELYPPNSRFPETAKQGEEFMIWALKRFADRYNWRDLSDDILKDMAYYCKRHEEIMENVNKDSLK